MKHSKPCFHYDKTPGRVLVVGSKIYEGRPDWRIEHPGGVGLDMLEGDGVDIVHNLESETPADMIGAFGHIECISILEHCERPWVAAPHLEEMLKPGGSIYLSVPFVWRFHAYPNDYWRFTHEALPVLFSRIDWQRVGYSNAGVFDEVPQKKYVRKGSEKSLIRSELVAYGVKQC